MMIIIDDQRSLVVKHDRDSLPSGVRVIVRLGRKSESVTLTPGQAETLAGLLLCYATGGIDISGWIRQTVELARLSRQQGGGPPTGRFSP